MQYETRFPVRIPVEVAWGEMDALGHVNNIIYLRYFESARIEYFRRIAMPMPVAGGEPSTHGPILASTRCDYKIPLTFPDRVEVRAGISRIGKSSFTMLYEVHSAAHGALAASGEAINVYYDYAGQKSAPLPADLLERIRLLEED